MSTKQFWAALLATVSLLILLTSPGSTATLAEDAVEAHLYHDPHTIDEVARGQPWPGSIYPSRPKQRVCPDHANPKGSPALAAVGDGPPAGIDLDVVTISREPLYWAYCVRYDDGIPSLCPGTETEQRWPSPGETVTFTARIINQGTTASPSFDFAWAIDGVTFTTGTLPGLGAGDEVTTTLSWLWDHTMMAESVVDDHTVRFTADPTGAVPETYDSNNTLEDRTNALSLYIAITPEMVAAYDVPWHPDAPYSAEDWLQKQVAAMNWALENSVYPTTPAGATERVRINRIDVTSSSPVNDGSHDGGWFVNADYRVTSGGYDPVTDIDWYFVHELSHQVGLIDLYNLDIAATSVDVLDREGMPVNFGFRWPNGGLMGGGDITPHTDPHLYSSHSAAGLTVNKGYRRGYYGEYQYDIPHEVFLRVLDNTGAPASGVAVSMYQRTGAPNWIGELVLDNTAEITGVTGIDGRFAVTNRSVGVGTSTRTGHLLHDNPFGVVDVVGKENRFLVGLARGDHEEFHWLDLTTLNLAFWAGDSLRHTLTITSHVPPDDAPDPPRIVTRQIEGESAVLCWEPVSPTVVAGYNVYRAAHPTYLYESLGSPVSGTCFTQTASSVHRIYAVTVVDLLGRESGFSSAIWAPRLMRPHDAGLLSDGTRIILDPQNGYALLMQRADGRYIRQIGSPHYHLEYSHFLTVDEQDRLVISHPGDYYTDRHSVRVADTTGEPILEFGQRGSGEGEFLGPAGVATWGHACTHGGPYVGDSATLLLVHFEGTADGVDGEPGTASGVTYTAGVHGLGLGLHSGDTLTYTTAGNLNQAEGAVEFWLQPKWDGDDGASHTFFEVGDGWYNRMRVMKDGANNLRFMTWDGTHETGVATYVGDWFAGEWHHVAATWDGPRIALCVDGQECDARDDAALPGALAREIMVGAAWDGGQSAEAVIDELRISSVARVGDSDTCGHRILVADSGNDRVQVFDASGTFVSAFGSAGAGLGQFDSPQGLAVDPLGSLIVADAGNNRLQRLAFDGSTLQALSVITADLDNPSGLAVGTLSRILVADTGHNQVKVLDRAGTVLATYTAPNDGHAGPFSAPRNAVPDGLGSIIVLDTGNRRVVKLGDVLPREAVYLPLVFRQ